MNMMTFTKTVLHNLFSKPVTHLYPFVPKVYPQRTRGHIAVDIDACIFCGICANKCPTGTITVNRAEKTWSIEPFGCIQCSFCVESCPKHCLSMMQTYTKPGKIKTLDTFTQSANENNL